MIIRACVLLMFVGMACTPLHKQSKGSSTHKMKKTTKKEVKQMTSENFACELKGEKRSVEIRKPDSGGCEVVYTKAGSTNVVADAKSDMGYCQKVAGNIRNNLSSAGYSCN